MEMRDREQLLNRRFTSNTETTIDLDYSLQQHNSMNNAHQGIDEMLITGNYEISLVVRSTGSMCKKIVAQTSDVKLQR